MNTQVLDSSTKITRQKRVEWIREWADVTTDALLDSKCLVYVYEGIEGFIGYKIQSGHAVVFGEPVTSAENKEKLAIAFEEECQKQNIKIIYAIVSKEFADWVNRRFSAITIEFGQTFQFDPYQNPARQTGSKAVLVRKKVKHAQAEGATVHEYLNEDPCIEKSISDVAASWLKNRSGPQVYISHVTLFNDRLGKRWFYAKKNGEIVGFLVLNKVQSKHGWLLNHVMITENAPKGLSELLIISTLEALEKENCHVVIAGPVPLKQLGQITGVGELKLKLIHFAYNLAKYFLKLDGHSAFWDKFQPECKNSFLVFPHNHLGISSVKALMQALNVMNG